MLRGAIERVDEMHIQGWVFSPLVKVKGLKLLAFHGTRCAGAGIVEIFREDLAKAGLGDGYCGFRFAYTLVGDEQPRHLTVRFEACDFELRQADTVVLGKEEWVAGVGGTPVTDQGAADNPARWAESVWAPR